MTTPPNLVTTHFLFDIGTNQPDELRRGRLLQWFVLFVTGLLYLRLIWLGVEQFFNPNLTFSSLHFWSTFVGGTVSTAGAWYFLRQGHITLAAHVYMFPLSAGALLLTIAIPETALLLSYFFIVPVIVATFVLSLRESWFYALFPLVSSFYLRDTPHLAETYLLVIANLLLMLYFVKRQEIQTLQTVQQGAEELQQLNQSLQMQVREQTADLTGRNERLKFSMEVGRVASASLNLDDLLHNTVKLIHQEFDFSHVTVFLVDDLNRHLTLKESNGQVGQQLKELMVRLPVNDSSIIGWVANHREFRLVPNVHEEPLYYRHPLLPNTHAELALPMMARNYLIGVLDIQSDVYNAFAHEDITILQLMADQLANNIDNALLFTELERRTNQLTELQTTLSLMNQQTTTRNALNVLIQRAQDLVQAYGVGVFLWQEKIGRLELMLELNLGQGVTVGQRLKPGEGVVGQSFKEGRFYQIEDYNNWEGRVGTIGRVDFHAILAVPIREREKVIGVIAFTRQLGSPPFDHEEIQLIELLTSQAGTIITNQQLIEDTQQLVRRERILNQISAEVRRSLDLETILQSATQELGQTLGTRRVTARLYPQAKSKKS